MLLTTEFPLEPVSASHHTKPGNGIFFFFIIFIRINFFLVPSSGARSYRSCCCGKFGRKMLCCKGMLRVLFPPNTYPKDSLVHGNQCRSSAEAIYPLGNKRWKNMAVIRKNPFFVKADLRGSWSWSHFKWGVLEAKIIQLQAEYSFQKPTCQKDLDHHQQEFERPHRSRDVEVVDLRFHPLS